MCYRYHHRRFIPTQVGNTSQAKLVTCCLPGSSPHKWGIQGVDRSQWLHLRFIPTQVGNTVVSCSSSSGSSVHPHTSGEYMTISERLVGMLGSSPHKWGILSPHPFRLWLARFIPTQVGNTDRGRSRESSIPVHPQTSGEYFFIISG